MLFKSKTYCRETNNLVAEPYLLCPSQTFGAELVAHKSVQPITFPPKPVKGFGTLFSAQTTLATTSFLWSCNG